MTSLQRLRAQLHLHAIPEKAEFLQRFFKTGKGQYAEGDQFLGITVPVQRKIASQFSDLSLSDITRLLKSGWHEERLTALLIMVNQYRKGNDEVREKLFDLYLNHTKYINNWDLVDSSAEYIVGARLENRDKSLLFNLANSDWLWDRRIATLATFFYIKKGDPTLTFQIAEILLRDTHDLIHKAVGWMLREAGKRCSEEELENFLQQHYKQMPRTMLRYAIERLEPEKRLEWLQKK